MRKRRSALPIAEVNEVILSSRPNKKAAFMAVSLYLNYGIRVQTSEERDSITNESETGGRRLILSVPHQCRLESPLYVF
ncbi:MAG: hypothetical protein J6T72_00550 [Alphaproteobacteria bacterium]|nr:hypothetical protein [Alphaproteobacteria bacterium]